MSESLIEALSQRENQIIERRKYLEQYIKEYRDLTEEHQLITSLLQKYRVSSTNILSSPPSNISPSIPSTAQDSMPIPYVQNTQEPSRIKPRQSPGETEKSVDYILSRGEAHSIISLVRKIREVLGIKHSDSTIGVVLRRGLEQGKYKRDGSIWSMVLDQSQGEQQQEETILSNNGQKSADDDTHPLLAVMRMETSGNNA